MSESLERRLLAQLFFNWMEARTGGQGVDDSPGDAGAFAAKLDGRRVLIAIEPANTDEPPEQWRAGVDAFSGRLQSGDGGVLVWLPAGAEVPVQEPRASVVIDALQQAIAALGSGEAADAELPITISIRKRDDAGAYVSAFGGLAPLWAQFTDRVQGYFQIDSTQLHRLPDDEAYMRALIDRIVEASKGLALNEAATVEAGDFWRVQRLRGGAGCAVIGLPPDDETESGAALRKRLRAVLRAARERLAGQIADLRVLTIYGHYASIDDEPVGPALRGQDPALFGGLDMVALIADGAVKPLIDITRQTALQPGARG